MYPQARIDLTTKPKETEFLKGDLVSDFLAGTGFSIIDKFSYINEKGPRPIGATDPLF